MKLRGIVQRILWGDDSVRLPTALDPMIWIWAATCPSFLVSAYVFQADRPLVYVLVGSAALPMLLAQAAYAYSMFRDPDRLQAITFKSAPSGRN